MESLDPDFEYPHHRKVLNQIKPRLSIWSQEDEKKFGDHLKISDLREIITDLESQVLFYEANQNAITLPDLSHLVQLFLEEDTYLLFYHYKLLRQKLVQKRLSASQIISEMIQNYEKTLGINN